MMNITIEIPAVIKISASAEIAAVKWAGKRECILHLLIFETPAGGRWFPSFPSYGVGRHLFGYNFGHELQKCFGHRKLERHWIAHNRRNGEGGISGSCDHARPRAPFASG